MDKDIAVYLRVSSDEQREQQTIATQQSMIEHHLKQAGLLDRIYSWYADDGVSGTVPFEQRPESRRLLKDVQQGHIKQVLVYRVDRIGRDASVILNTVNAITRLGTQVKSITEDFDTSTPAGYFTLTMLSGFAGYEKASILERTSSGLLRVVREGAWAGNALYGYTTVGKRAGTRLVINDDLIPGHDLSEAGVVRLVFHLVLHERYSTQRIANYLNQRQIPSQNAAYLGMKLYRPDVIWQKGRVLRMISNPTYKGQHSYHAKGEEVIQSVPALVSEQDWDAANRQLRARNTQTVRHMKYASLLRGLIRCGMCNSAYVYTLHSSAHPNSCYYVCTGKLGRKLGIDGKFDRCSSAMIRADELEQELWNTIVEYCRNPREAISKLQSKVGENQDHAKVLRGRIARFHQQLQAKRSERDSVITMMRRGLITEADLTRQLDMITNEEARLKADLESCQQRLTDEEDAQRSLVEAEGILTKLRHEIHKPLSLERRQQIVRGLIGSIIVYSEPHPNNPHKRLGHVHVTWHFKETDIMSHVGVKMIPLTRAAR